MKAARTCFTGRQPRGQHGLSLVELMVGLAVGLLVMAAGTALLTHHLHDSRQLLLEARLMQDLRTAADVVTRDLRRAGYWGEASAGVASTSGLAVRPNPYSTFMPRAAASDAVSFQYSRDAAENHQVDTPEQFGFRLRRGVLEMLLGAGNWQALTDATTLRVTQFNVVPTQESISLQSLCAQACAPSSSTCPPQHHVRSLSLLISAQSVTQPQLQRTLRSAVRLRNDSLTGTCPV
jgi:prepilin peptidase dependent protein B